MIGRCNVSSHDRESDTDNERRAVRILLDIYPK